MDTGPADVRPGTLPAEDTGGVGGAEDAGQEEQGDSLDRAGHDVGILVATLPIINQWVHDLNTTEGLDPQEKSVLNARAVIAADMIVSIAQSIAHASAMANQGPDLILPRGGF